MDRSSCSSARRPSSCQFVELHVLYVPAHRWNLKLNKVPAEAAESFISAGFIRLHPDVSLRTLRKDLGVLLGAGGSIDRFSFLKCVGRSLVLVRNKQERELKVKTFAPPYAVQPELYLLPTLEADSSSQSFSPDTSSSSPEPHIFYQPPGATKEPVKLPQIPQSSQQAPPTPRLEEEEDEDEEEEEEQIYSSSEAGEDEEEVLSSMRRPVKLQNQRPPQLLPLNKVFADLCEVDPAQMKQLPDREETFMMKNQRGSRAAESLEDSGDSGLSLTDGVGKSNPLKSVRNKPAAEATGGPAVVSGSVLGPGGPDSAPVPRKTLPVFHGVNREELMEEMKLAKEERKQLEWTRRELLRKGKDLLAQNRHRRNQARDSWKKKYFETKKATAPLEDNLRSLRQELETFYNKLLQQLQARDGRAKPRRGRSSVKNELIIQIMTESYEIDDLKRKVEDAKMKLLTEMKLRKQASTELRALKAELAQKRSQSTHPGPKRNDTRRV